MKETKLVEATIKNGRSAVNAYQNTRKRLIDEKLLPESATILGGSLLTLNVLFATRPDILPEPLATIGRGIAQRSFPFNATAIASGVYTGSIILNNGAKRLLNESLPYYKACTGLIVEDAQQTLRESSHILRRFVND